MNPDREPTPEELAKFQELQMYPRMLISANFDDLQLDPNGCTVISYPRPMPKPQEWGIKPRFIALFWFTGWHCLGLGLHLDIKAPRLELHIPFGFISIGWRKSPWPAKWGWRVGAQRRGFGLVDSPR